jgi:hypothetical protein
MSEGQGFAAMLLISGQKAQFAHSADRILSSSTFIQDQAAEMLL